MSTITAADVQPGECLRLSYVDWKTYSQLLKAFAEYPGVRLTYDDGELEIMSPLLTHDDDSRTFYSLVLILTEEMNLPLKHGGSVTMRRSIRKKGIEADECFWIANAHSIKGRRRLDLRRDPPPDLAIEIDVTSKSLARLPIYAALRVPEVWRLNGDKLIFYVLDESGNYVPSATSRAFTFVTPADLLKFVKRARRSGDVIPVLHQFRAWIRRRLAEKPQNA